MPFPRTRRAATAMRLRPRRAASVATSSQLNGATGMVVQPIPKPSIRPTVPGPPQKMRVPIGIGHSSAAHLLRIRPRGQHRPVHKTAAVVHLLAGARQARARGLRPGAQTTRYRFPVGHLRHARAGHVAPCTPAAITVLAAGRHALAVDAIAEGPGVTDSSHGAPCAPTTYLPSSQ
jgi:hypothetical protein